MSDSFPQNRNKSIFQPVISQVIHIQLFITQSGSWASSKKRRRKNITKRKGFRLWRVLKDDCDVQWRRKWRMKHVAVIFGNSVELQWELSVNFLLFFLRKANKQITKMQANTIEEQTEILTNVTNANKYIFIWLWMTCILFSFQSVCFILL